MRTIFCWTLAVLLAFIGVVAPQARSQDTDKKETDTKAKVASRVRRLVRRLDADELKVRDQAEKDLIELGEAVLDYLPSVNARTPAEVKERLGRITRLLETKVAENATKASLVTLDGEMSLQEALAAIEKQTGNRFFGADEREASLNLKFKKRPFWEVADEILDQANLNINQYGGQANQLSLMARPEEERNRVGNATYSGLFRFEATRIESTRGLRNPQVKGLRLQLNVTWEPRTTPIVLAQPLTQLKAFDENDEPIAVDGDSTRASLGAADISSVDLTLPFELPARGIKEIARLEGTLNALVPGRKEAFEFSDITRGNQAARKAGATVILERARKAGGTFEVRMKLQFDEASNALESHRGWVTRNEAFLVDGKGTMIPNESLESTSRTQTSVGFAYRFALKGDPKKCKFVYKTPALIVELPIKYTLKNIPLP